MLRCPQCGSEDQFEVDEVVHHTILVQIHDTQQWSFEVVEELEIHDNTMQYVTCCACREFVEAHEAMDAYNDAREDEDKPLPYTLVDASIS